jgi:hypothetical protein
MRLNLEKIKNNLNRRPDSKSYRERSFLDKSSRQTPSPSPSKNKTMYNYNCKTNLIQQVKKTVPKPKINHTHSNSQNNFKNELNKPSEDKMNRDYEKYLKFNKIGKNATFHEKNQTQTSKNNNTTINNSFNNDRSFNKKPQDTLKDMTKNRKKFNYNNEFYNDFKNGYNITDESDNFQIQNNSVLSRSGRDLTPPPKMQEEKRNFDHRPKSALKFEKEIQEVSADILEDYERLDFSGTGPYKRNRDYSGENR